MIDSSGVLQIIDDQTTPDRRRCGGGFDRVRRDNTSAVRDLVDGAEAFL